MSFKPLLAEKPDFRWPLRFPFYASPKYDGIRCVVLDELGPVSRKLKPIPNRALREMLSHPVLRNLDGELLAGEPHDRNAMQTTTSAVMSHVADFSQVKFYVFDYIEDCQKPFAERMRATAAVYMAARSLGLSIVLVEQELIHNEQQLNEYETKCLAKGYEGVILRSPGGHYKFGRSTAREQIMLKIKRFLDTEGEIVGFFEQQTNTNEQTRDELGYAKRSSAQDGKVGLGTLGGMIVKLGMEWASSTVDIGTGQGWTKEFRQEVWDNQDQYLGKILKYKYQDIGSKDAPRLPIGLGFRAEEDLEL